MKNIYLSSTLKKDWNLNFNKELAEALEKAGLTVYLPQRDTDQEDGLDLIFKQDINGMAEADKILVVVKNASENLWLEVGWAYAKNKPIIILADETDFIPVFGKKMAIKIIKVESLDNIKSYTDDLIKIIKLK